MHCRFALMLFSRYKLRSQFGSLVAEALHLDYVNSPWARFRKFKVDRSTCITLIINGRPSYKPAKPPTLQPERFKDLAFY
jgi:hypothetical protein